MSDSWGKKGSVSNHSIFAHWFVHRVLNSETDQPTYSIRKMDIHG